MPGSNNANSNNADSNNANSNNARGSVPFEKILEYLLNGSSGTTLLDCCLDPKDKEAAKAPLRCRIIALGFLEGYDLDQLNQELEKCKCERLYARNLLEATLIYAFKNRYSYEQWKEKYADAAKRQLTPHDSDLSSGKTTLRELRKYVTDNSDINDGQLVTRHLTRMMQQTIEESSEKEFEKWLNENISQFSSAREKTRYYFCKYLLYYLDSIVEQYIKARKTGRGLEDALDKVSVFKISSKLIRSKLSEAEMRAMFENSAISPGELFDMFNYFYFGYVSVNWVDALLEIYEDPEKLPPETKKIIINLYKKKFPILRGLSDDKIIAWIKKYLEEQEAEIDNVYGGNNPNKGYQKGRSGENTVRRYLQGKLDLDRTNLICYLIFFGHSCKLPTDQIITVDRLNTILDECGYTALNPLDEFDGFVIRFLNSDDPVETLMDEVSEFARDGRNFYLYRLYRLSNSVDDTWSSLLGE